MALAEATHRPALGGVTVVPMRRRHLHAVLAIERQVYPRPWSAALFLSELGHTDSRRYVVALAPRASVALPAGRRVVGYAGVIVQVGEAHITTVAVHPAHHRQKVASHLLVDLLDRAVALGAGSATLEVRAANRGAQRLYSGFGFAPVGVRRRYYSETGEDAVIMWAYELDSPEQRARRERQRARLSAPGGASGVPDLHVPWVRNRRGLEGGA